MTLTATIYPPRGNRFEMLLNSQSPAIAEVICIRDNEVSELKRFVNEVAHVRNAGRSFTSVYVITTSKLKWMFTLHNDEWDGYEKMRQSLKKRSAQIALRH